MKTSTAPIAPTTRHATFRLLAALFFLCLFAPVAMGQNNPVADDNWQNHVATKIDNVEGSSGTSWNNAILIASAKELAYFAQQVNAGQAIKYGSGDDQIEPKGKDQKGGFKGYYFALSADIDLKDHYWTPIGTFDNPFKGNFDGKGHCVSGLKVNVNVNENSRQDYGGLFGKADFSTLQNLGVHLAKEGIQMTGESLKK